MSEAREFPVASSPLEGHPAARQDAGFVPAPQFFGEGGAFSAPGEVNERVIAQIGEWYECDLAPIAEEDECAFAATGDADECAAAPTGRADECAATPTEEEDASAFASAVRDAASRIVDDILESANSLASLSLVEPPSMEWEAIPSTIGEPLELTQALEWAQGPVDPRWEGECNISFLTTGEDDEIVATANQILDDLESGEAELTFGDFAAPIQDELNPSDLEELETVLEEEGVAGEFRELREIHMITPRVVIPTRMNEPEVRGVFFLEPKQLVAQPPASEPVQGSEPTPSEARRVTRVIGKRIVHIQDDSRVVSGEHGSASYAQAAINNTVGGEWVEEDIIEVLPQPVVKQRKPKVETPPREQIATEFWPRLRHLKKTQEVPLAIFQRWRVAKGKAEGRVKAAQKQNLKAIRVANRRQRAEEFVRTINKLAHGASTERMRKAAYEWAMTHSQNRKLQARKFFKEYLPQMPSKPSPVRGKKEAPPRLPQANSPKQHHNWEIAFERRLISASKGAVREVIFKPRKERTVRLLLILRLALARIRFRRFSRDKQWASGLLPAYLAAQSRSVVRAILPKNQEECECGTQTSSVDPQLLEQAEKSIFGALGAFGLGAITASLVGSVGSLISNLVAVSTASNYDTPHGKACIVATCFSFISVLGASLLTCKHLETVQQLNDVLDKASGSAIQFVKEVITEKKETRDPMTPVEVPPPAPEIKTELEKQEELSRVLDIGLEEFEQLNESERDETPTFSTDSEEDGPFTRFGQYFELTADEKAIKEDPPLLVGFDQINEWRTARGYMNYVPYSNSFLAPSLPTMRECKVTGCKPSKHKTFLSYRNVTDPYPMLVGHCKHGGYVEINNIDMLQDQLVSEALFHFLLEGSWPTAHDATLSMLSNNYTAIEADKEEPYEDSCRKYRESLINMDLYGWVISLISNPHNSPTLVDTAKLNGKDIKRSTQFYADVGDAVESEIVNQDEVPSWLPHITTIILGIAGIFLVALGCEKSKLLAQIPKSFGFIKDLVLHGKDTYSGLLDFVKGTIFQQKTEASTTKEGISILVVELHELMAKPYITLCEDNQFMASFEKKLKEASETLQTLKSSPLANTLANVYTAARRRFSDLKEEWESLTIRQVPVCVTIYGPGGCGKTTANGKILDHFAEKWCQGKIYNIDPMAKYFETYFGQSVARVQELGNSPLESSIYVAASNSIIGSAPFCMQGAFTKDQFCRLNLIMEDMNITPEELVKALPLSAYGKKPFMERRAIFRAEPTGLNMKAERTKRGFKSDYSHITYIPVHIEADKNSDTMFDFVDGNVVVKNKSMAKLKLEDLQEYIEEQCAANKENYLTLIAEKKEQLKKKDEEDRKAEAAKAKTQSLEVESKKHLSVLFSGPPGHGKSTVIGVIVETLTKQGFEVYPLTDVHAGWLKAKELKMNFSRWNPTQSKGYVVVMDDFITDKEKHEEFLLQLYNNMPDHSIWLIGTNVHPLYHKMTFGPSGKFATAQFQNPALYRRLGYHGAFSSLPDFKFSIGWWLKFNEQNFVKNENPLHFTVKEHQIYRIADDKEVTIRQVQHSICEEMSGILSFERTPTIETSPVALVPNDPVVYVHAENISQLLSMLNNQTSLMSWMMSKSSMGARKHGLYVDFDKFAARRVPSMSQIEWKGEVKTANDIYGVAEKYSRLVTECGIVSEVFVEVDGICQFKVVRGHTLFKSLVEELKDPELSVKYCPDTKRILLCEKDKNGIDRVAMRMNIQDYFVNYHSSDYSPAEKLKYQRWAHLLTEVPKGAEDAVLHLSATWAKVKKQKLKLAAFTKAKDFLNDYKWYIAGVTALIAAMAGVVFLMRRGRPEDEHKELVKLAAICHQEGIKYPAELPKVDTNTKEYREALTEQAAKHEARNKTSAFFGSHWNKSRGKGGKSQRQWTQQEYDEWLANHPEYKKEPLDLDGINSLFDYEDRYGGNYNVRFKGKTIDPDAWDTDNLDTSWADDSFDWDADFQSAKNQGVNATHNISYSDKVAQKFPGVKVKLENQAVSTPTHNADTRTFMENTYSPFRKNLCVVSSPAGTTFGLFIKERTVLAPRHLFVKAGAIYDVAKVSFDIKDKHHEYDAKVTGMPERKDFAILECVKQCPDFQNIMDKFISAEVLNAKYAERERIAGLECFLVKSHKDKEMYIDVRADGWISDCVFSKNPLPADEVLQNIVTTGDAATGDGDCGSPVFVHAPARYNFPACLGIHVAAVEGSSKLYTQIITRDDLYTYMDYKGELETTKQILKKANIDPDTFGNPGVKLVEVPTPQKKKPTTFCARCKHPHYFEYAEGHSDGPRAYASNTHIHSQGRHNGWDFHGKNWDELFKLKTIGGAQYTMGKNADIYEIKAHIFMINSVYTSTTDCVHFLTTGYNWKGADMERFKSVIKTIEPKPWKFDARIVTSVASNTSKVIIYDKRIYYLTHEEWNRAKPKKPITHQMKEEPHLVAKFYQFVEDAKNSEIPPLIEFPKGGEVKVVGTVGFDMSGEVVSEFCETPWFDLACQKLGPPKKIPAVHRIRMTEEQKELLAKNTLGNPDKVAHQLLMLGEKLPRPTEQELDQVVEEMWPFFDKHFGRFCRFASFEEVLSGVPRRSFDPVTLSLIQRFEGLNVQTSTGQMLKEAFGGGQKNRYVKVVDDITGKRDWANNAPAQHLKEAFEYCAEHIVEDDFEVPAGFLVCEKMELLKPEKAHKGRVFYAPDFLLTLLERYVLGYLNAAHTRADLDVSCRVGIDTETGFDTLMKYHCGVGFESDGDVVFFAGDYERLDKRIRAWLWETLLKLASLSARRHYPGQAEKWITAFKNLSKAIYSPYLFARNMIVKPSGCMPSGSLVTAAFNSDFLEIMFYMSFRELVNKRSFTAFKTNVALSTYGDDNLTTVRERVAGVFNLQTIAKYQKKAFGMVLDSDKKDGNVKPYYKDPGEISFISKTPVFHELIGLWTGALVKSTIESLLYFSRSPQDQPEHLAELCDAAVNAAAMWGPEYHKYIRDTVIVLTTSNRPIIKKVADLLVLETYGGYLDLIFARYRKVISLVNQASVKMSSTNAISAINELVQSGAVAILKSDADPTPQGWEWNIKILRLTDQEKSPLFAGSGNSKGLAKLLAYQAALDWYYSSSLVNQSVENPTEYEQTLQSFANERWLNAGDVDETIQRFFPEVIVDHQMQRHLAAQAVLDIQNEPLPEVLDQYVGAIEQHKNIMAEMGYDIARTTPDACAKARCLVRTGKIRIQRSFYEKLEDGTFEWSIQIIRMSDLQQSPLFTAPGTKRYQAKELAYEVALDWYGRDAPENQDITTTNPLAAVAQPKSSATQPRVTTSMTATTDPSNAAEYVQHAPGGSYDSASYGVDSTVAPAAMVNDFNWSRIASANVSLTTFDVASQPDQGSALMNFVNQQWLEKEIVLNSQATKGTLLAEGSSNLQDSNCPDEIKNYQKIHRVRVNHLQIRISTNSAVGQRGTLRLITGLQKVSTLTAYDVGTLTSCGFKYYDLSLETKIEHLMDLKPIPNPANLPGTAGSETHIYWGLLLLDEIASTFNADTAQSDINLRLYGRLGPDHWESGPLDSLASCFVKQTQSSPNFGIMDYQSTIYAGDLTVVVDSNAIPAFEFSPDVVDTGKQLLAGGETSLASDFTRETPVMWADAEGTQGATDTIPVFVLGTFPHTALQEFYKQSNGLGSSANWPVLITRTFPNSVVAEVAPSEGKIYLEFGSPYPGFEMIRQLPSPKWEYKCYLVSTGNTSGEIWTPVEQPGVKYYATGEDKSAENAYWVVRVDAVGGAVGNPNIPSLPNNYVDSAVRKGTPDLDSASIKHNSYWLGGMPINVDDLLLAQATAETHSAEYKHVSFLDAFVQKQSGGPTPSSWQHYSALVKKLYDFCKQNNSPTCDFDIIYRGSNLITIRFDIARGFLCNTTREYVAYVSNTETITFTAPRLSSGGLTPSSLTSFSSIYTPPKMEMRRRKARAAKNQMMAWMAASAVGGGATGLANVLGTKAQYTQQMKYLGAKGEIARQNAEFQSKLDVQKQRQLLGLSATAQKFGRITPVSATVNHGADDFQKGSDIRQAVSRGTQPTHDSGTNVDFDLPNPKGQAPTPPKVDSETEVDETPVQTQSKETPKVAPVQDLGEVHDEGSSV